MNTWMTGRFLRGDKLSKLQGKTIMLISGCSHQSSRVNVVSRRHVPDPPSGHSTARVKECVCLHAAVRVCLFGKGRIDHTPITPGDLRLRGAALLDMS